MVRSMAAPRPWPAPRPRRWGCPAGAGWATDSSRRVLQPISTTASMGAEVKASRSSPVSVSSSRPAPMAPVSSARPSSIAMFMGSRNASRTRSSITKPMMPERPRRSDWARGSGPRSRVAPRPREPGPASPRHRSGPLKASDAVDGETPRARPRRRDSASRAPGLPRSSWLGSLVESNRSNRFDDRRNRSPECPQQWCRPRRRGCPRPRSFAGETRLFVIFAACGISISCFAARIPTISLALSLSTARSACCSRRWHSARSSDSSRPGTSSPSSGQDARSSSRSPCSRPSLTVAGLASPSSGRSR